MLQPALSKWWDVCRRSQPVQMHLSSRKDWEPLSAAGPDRYVAVMGRVRTFHCREWKARPSADRAGAQFPTWAVGSSPVHTSASES